jgi:hypothetical protein
MKPIVKSTILGLLLTALLTWRWPVSANAAPPPAKLWFTFVYSTEPHPRLEGVQWVVCADETCDPPAFVQTHGVCDLPGCVLGAPLPRVTFACAGELCLATIPYGEAGTAFQLIAQFSDGVRVSPITAGMPTSWSDDKAWQVQVQGTELVLTEDAAFVAPESARPDFLTSFFLTLIVELVVAAAVLWFWKKSERKLLGKRLLWCKCIQPFSYLLARSVFPAWYAIPAAFIGAHLASMYGVGGFLHSHAAVDFPV